MKYRMTTFLPGIAIAVCAIGLSGCVTQTEQRGRFLPPGQTGFLAPGVSQTQVELELGSPTLVTDLGHKTALYISEDITKRAFFAPRLTGRTVIAIQYDDNDTLKNLQIYALEDGRDVNAVMRKTRTAGRDMGLVDQIMRGRARGR